MKPLVYLAGPYSSDPPGNVRAVTRIALDLWRAGAVVPYVPHWSMLGDLVAPMGYDQWLAFSCDVVLHCDAVLRLPGPSAGADREVDYAHANRIPVFGTVSLLMAWTAGR